MAIALELDLGQERRDQVGVNGMVCGPHNMGEEEYQSNFERCRESVLRRVALILRRRRVSARLWVACYRMYAPGNAKCP